MSSFNRRQFVVTATAFGLGAVLGLAGCGFTPAYGPGGGANVLQNTILAAEPRDKYAFDLVERLEERLGRTQAARYALSYAISVSSVGVAYNPENAITRINLNGAVNWQLTDVASGAQVSAGRADGFTGYSATGSTVAIQAADVDAKRRLMRILADQIVTQLLVGSGQWAGK